MISIIAGPGHGWRAGRRDGGRLPGHRQVLRRQRPRGLHRVHQLLLQTEPVLTGLMSHKFYIFAVYMRDKGTNYLLHSHKHFMKIEIDKTAACRITCVDTELCEVISDWCVNVLYWAAHLISALYTVLFAPDDCTIIALPNTCAAALHSVQLCAILA